MDTILILEVNTDAFGGVLVVVMKIGASCLVGFEVSGGDGPWLPENVGGLRGWGELRGQGALHFNTWPVPSGAHQWDCCGWVLG